METSEPFCHAPQQAAHEGPVGVVPQSGPPFGCPEVLREAVQALWASLGPAREGLTI